MDEIKEYVNRMFTGLPKSKAVLDMKRNILGSMQEHYEDLISQGKSKNEALGAVISQFGNIDEIKKELGIEDHAEELQRNGILETIFAYFSPDVLFWRMLIHKSPAETLIFFSALAVHLLLGLTLQGWGVSWTVFLLADLIILLLDHRKSTGINYRSEVDSHYGILETIFAYFSPGVLFWRILVHKNSAEAVIFFSALAIHLLLGFTLNLWSVSWTVLLAAGFTILLYERHEQSEKNLVNPS
jgi:hypothetical protein